jgi:hypothetical protein
MLNPAGPVAMRWVLTTVTLHPAVAFGNPVGLASGALQIQGLDWWRHYDMARDGRIIGLIPDDESLAPDSQRSVHVVLNWHEELKQRVPVKAIGCIRREVPIACELPGGVPLQGKGSTYGGVLKSTTALGPGRSRRLMSMVRSAGT